MEEKIPLACLCLFCDQKNLKSEEEYSGFKMEDAQKMD